MNLARKANQMEVTVAANMRCPNCGGEPKVEDFTKGAVPCGKCGKTNLVHTWMVVQKIVQRGFRLDQ